MECVLEIARRYRQLEEENESYRQCKEVFASLYEKERGKENKSYNSRYITLIRIGTSFKSLWHTPESAAPGQQVPGMFICTSMIQDLQDKYAKTH